MLTSEPKLLLSFEESKFVQQHHTSTRKALRHGLLLGLHAVFTFG